MVSAGMVYTEECCWFGVAGDGGGVGVGDLRGWYRQSSGMARSSREARHGEVNQASMRGWSTS